MIAPAPHLPVMFDRVVQLLAEAPEGTTVDCTLGAGGHAAGVLETRTVRYGSAHLVGIDRDDLAFDLARERFADLPGGASFDLAKARFDAFDEVLDDLGVGQVAGVLFDLGISSMHVDRAERGFSYRQDGPLDMRMDPSQGPSAADVVNTYDQRELFRVLREYGEERSADRIARAIVEHRPLSTTTELAEVVRDAIPAALRRTGGHPATRTFQALRIEVNSELDAFAAALPRAVERLIPGGICVVLAYHSLEDRLAKRFFADAASGCSCPPDLPVCACGRVPTLERITRKPERPSDDEVARNPRASAARLRAVRKLSTEAAQAAKKSGDVR